MITNISSLADRIWSSDFEIVYGSRKPYSNLLSKLSSLATSIVTIEGITEIWHHDKNNNTNIQICYHSNRKIHTIWTERVGDYLNVGILYLLNKQLNLNHYSFQCSISEESSIYFISAREKHKLEKEGIVFIEQSALLQFDLLLDNAIRTIGLKKIVLRTKLSLIYHMLCHNMKQQFKIKALQRKGV